MDRTTKTTLGKWVVTKKCEEPEPTCFWEVWGQRSRKEKRNGKGNTRSKEKGEKKTSIEWGKTTK